MTLRRELDVAASAKPTAWMDSETAHELSVSWKLKHISSDFVYTLHQRPRCLFL